MLSGEVTRTVKKTTRSKGPVNIFEKGAGRVKKNITSRKVDFRARTRDP